MDIDIRYILNEKNVLITEKYIEDVLHEYGIKYKVVNIDNFRKAMVHSSYVIRDDAYWKLHRSKNRTQDKDISPISDINKAIPLQDKSYEELELLGDGVIHLILADYFTMRYEGQGEGFMTKLRTKIENGETLTMFTEKIGLNRYILLSRYIEHNNGRRDNKSILEDAFEAFIGALYRDSADSTNFEVCRRFIINLIEREVDIAEILHNENNFKDLLLQFFHVKKWGDPVYNTILQTNTPENKVFTVAVIKKENIKDIGEVCGTGSGSSKKKAEQQAAKDALGRLQKAI